MTPSRSVQRLGPPRPEAPSPTPAPRWAARKLPNPAPQPGARRDIAGFAETLGKLRVLVEDARRYGPSQGSQLQYEALRWRLLQLLPPVASALRALCVRLGQEPTTVDQLLSHPTLAMLVREDDPGLTERFELAERVVALACRAAEQAH